MPAPELPMQKSAPLMVISILNWNGWQNTVTCLKSVRQLNYSNYLIVIVDNGSTDDSVERIKGWAREDLGPGQSLVEYPAETALRGGEEASEAALDGAASAGRLVLIRNKENQGFTGGNNVGIQYSMRRNRPASCVFLLNNDAWPEPDCLTHIMAVHRQTGAGIVGAVVLDATDHHVHFAGRTTFLRSYFHPYVKQLPPPVTDEDSWETFTVYGTGLSVSREALEAICARTGEYLDTSIFIYGDEVALCTQALRAGYKTRLARRAVIYHRNGKSFEGLRDTIICYYGNRNLIRGARKFLPFQWWILFQVLQMPLFAGRILKRLIKGNRRGAWAMAVGLMDGYRDVGGKWKYDDAVRKQMAAARDSPSPS
jgi:hypothetical protein